MEYFQLENFLVNAKNLVSKTWRKFLNNSNVDNKQNADKSKNCPLEGVIFLLSPIFDILRVLHGNLR